MAKTDELVAVTSEDVAQAWADVEVARAAVADLKNKFVTGDDSVTQLDIASQQGVVEWLELVAQRVEHQRTRYEVQFAAQARRDLKAEILRRAPETGDELLKLLDDVYSSAIAFVDAADSHGAMVRDWEVRAKSLGVPNRGVVSDEHEGLGLSHSGTILIGDAAQVAPVNPGWVLGLLFDVVQNGVLPTRGESKVATARQIVANVGKAAV